MADWVAPKRFGYGAGLPISWQGWVVSILFLVLITATAIAFDDRPLILFAILVPLSSLFLIIIARNTRGGWRWRWGEDEKDSAD